GSRGGLPCVAILPGWGRATSQESCWCLLDHGVQKEAETLSCCGQRAVSLHAPLGSSCHGMTGLRLVTIALEGRPVGFAQRCPVDLLAQGAVGNAGVVRPHGGVGPAVYDEGDVFIYIVGQR